IKLYGLAPHPEGGYYRETYRSAAVLPATALSRAFDGDRNASTCIYYLLPQGRVSRLHRIKSDEIWHFYLGEPITLLQISPEGRTEKVVLGQDISTEQKVQHVVPA